MSALPTLIRREFWEHRALWLGPLAVAGLLLIAAAIGHIEMDFAHLMSPDQQLAALAIVQWALTAPLLLVAGTVLFFYLLDCLYAERKDRSILFWKSLPVSDAATVGSKLLVAVVVGPLVVYAIALVTHLLFLVIWAVRYAGEGLELWDTATWLTVHGFTLLWLVLAMLWYLPVAGYLMLVSAWARRNVFLWAVLPPLLAMMMEGIVFDTSHAAEFLRQRMIGLWGAFNLDGASFDVDGSEQVPPLRQLFEMTDVAAVFANPHLWIGLVLAVAFVLGAIRMRQYRDDT